MKSVFISSTFKDMQAERDYLHEKIFPKLRKIISQYGEDIQELDLRWGVDTYNMTEEESGYQVLRICVDAIDRCKPYIIVLLGDRYGWIPDVGTVASLRDERVASQYEENMSITNLEIKYGALSEEETLKRCIFCFRDSGFLQEIPEEKRAVYMAESEQHAKRIEELKCQIRTKENAKILDYYVNWDENDQKLCNLEAFGDALITKMSAILEEDFAGHKIKNPVEQILADAEYTKERYLSTYIPRMQEEKEGAEGILKMTEQKLHCLHFCGKGGCGKSALMASMENSAKRAGAHTILYYSGNPGCQSIDTLKDVLIYRLEEILGKKHRTEIADKNEYLRELGLQIKETPIFLFVDALDQLFGKSGNAYLDIVEMCPNLYVITSSLEDFSYGQALISAKSLQVIEIGKLGNKDKLQLIRTTCLYRGKTIDEQVQNLICEKEGSDNPLFLSLLLQRLFAMRQEDFQIAESMGAGMDGLHRYMEQIIKEMPHDIHQMAADLFSRVGRLFHSEFFETVANLIALARNGLTESEIREIMEMQKMEFSPMRFQEILFYLYDVFTENENGKWVFSHRIFYEALQENMGKAREQYIQYFIDYSQVNLAFMEQEGYFHILSDQHPSGVQVLEKCKDWKTYDQICRMAAEMLKREEGQEYFIQMMDEEDIKPVVNFFKKMQRFDHNEKIEQFRRNICLKAVEKKALSPEYKTELLMDVLKIDDVALWPEHFAKIRNLLPQYTDEGRRIHDELRLEYEEIIYQIYKEGKAEEGCKRLEKHLEELKKHFDNEAICEDMIYRYIFETQNLAYTVRRKLKKTASDRLLDALKIYEKYSQITDTRSFQLTKIDLCLELARHTEGTEYIETALKEARNWADKESSAEVLELLGHALNLYGRKVDPENRYVYRYESYLVSKRTYQITKTNYWKQVTADQAAYFAKDVKNYFPEPWKSRREEAWNLSLQYNDELYKDGYTDLYDTYYEKCILDCVEQEPNISYLKRAYEIIKDRKARGWNTTDVVEWNTIWRICAQFMEQLDETLCFEEAEKYLDETLEYSRKIYQVQHGVQDTIHLFYGLQLAAQTLYHCKKDEQAYLYAKEGLEILKQHEKDNKIIYPTATFEFCYIISRICLKKNDIENANVYLSQLERLDESNLKEDQKGRKYILQGDYLFQKNNYARAKAFYEKAIVFWHEKYKPKCNRLHFFYYMYAISQKAEAMLLGGIEEEKGTKDRYARKMYGYADAYTEYVYVFEQCLKKLHDDYAVEISRRFMFQAIKRLLEQKVSADYHDLDQFNYLCQMAAYCTRHGIDFSKEIQVLVDGLCKYDMNIMSIWLAFSKEMESTWLDIYPYIQERMENGSEILMDNYSLFARMWFRFGCYEEASKWAQLVTADNPRYEQSRQCYLLSEGMCALRDGDEERLHRLLKEINSGDVKEHKLNGNLYAATYYELAGSQGALEMKLPTDISLQETAQRYVNLIRFWSRKENYFLLERTLQEKLWDMARLVRQSYIEANLFYRENWESVSGKIKKITGKGMTWQVDFCDVEKEIYTAWGNLYDSCENLDEKGAVGKDIFRYWRECQDNTVLKWLSLDNLLLLRRVEEESGLAPSPNLVAEIARRTDDFNLLHEYFADFEMYMKIPDKLSIKEKRKKEAKYLLDSLLMENSSEWICDFKNWISTVNGISLVGDMEWMKDPDKQGLYEIYCQYMEYEKDEIMKKFHESVKKHAAG